MTIFQRLEKYRKAVVAAIGVAATYGAALATADLSTTQGIIGAILAVLTVAGVYQVPNRPARK
jgi:hypothetical protein